MNWWDLTGKFAEMKVIDGELYVLDGPFNMYFVGGKEPFVIEGGISGIYKEFKNGLFKLGFRPEDISAAFVLHAHPDHVMALSPMKEENPDMIIYGSEESAFSLDSPRIREKMKNMDRMISSSFLAARGENRFLRNTEPPRCESIVREGDVFTIGNHRVEIVETPGHSPCSISIVLDESILFVSDALGGFHPPELVDLNHFYNLSMFVSSIEKLSKIPCHTLCFGHSGFIKGESNVNSYFELLRHSLYSFIDDVDKNSRSREELRKVTEKYARMWHRDFLLFYPFEELCNLVSLVVKRTLEYLGKEAPSGC